MTSWGGLQCNTAVPSCRMLPSWSFRAIRVANEAPLFFYVRNALIVQPPYSHRPEDDTGVADSPWPFPAPARLMHFLPPYAQRDQLSPSRSGSSPSHRVGVAFTRVSSGKAAFYCASSGRVHALLRISSLFRSSSSHPGHSRSAPPERFEDSLERYLGPLCPLRSHSPGNRTILHHPSVPFTSGAK